MSELCEKTYLFTITLSGTGETSDDAWNNACESFSLEPGPTPEEYEVEEN